MHALIVVAHPNQRSLTHQIAAGVAAGAGDAGHTAEIADLAAENFDPRFTSSDHAVHLKTAAFPADVAAEHARIGRADALVLVFPVYWWSMPALLKGWMDRVFVNGWAYDHSEATGLVKKLRGCRVHLVGIGGADQGTYERRGYGAAMRAQIDHGIFDYCGAEVVSSQLLLESDSQDPAPKLQAAQALGRSLFGRMAGRRCA